jgi:hypothetical protein
MTVPDRRSTEPLPKEPAEGSRETVDEALARSQGAKPGAKRGKERLQEDAPPGRPALDD